MRPGGPIVPDNQNDKVDGFSDNMTEEKVPTHGETPGVPGSPDPGQAHGAAKPLSPEEYARLKKEAQEENADNER